MFVGAILKGTSKSSETVPANTYGAYLKIEERILDYTSSTSSGGTLYHYKLACRSIDTQGTDFMMVPEDELENSLMYGYYEFWTPPRQDRADAPIWEDME